MKYLNCLLFVGFLFMTSCEDPIFTPKPRGFPKIDFPAKAYQSFTEGYCGFTFDYPTYALIQQDTLFFDQKPVHPCWFDLLIPSLDAKIHCSYYPISAENSFDDLLTDAFEMANKHNLKANYIDEMRIQKENGVSGLVFNIDGPAASPFQFYLTDSTSHFLRGALYFNTQARPDSLAPVVDFVKKDILNMINTFEWKIKGPSR